MDLVQFRYFGAHHVCFAGSTINQVLFAEASCVLCVITLCYNINFHYVMYFTHKVILAAGTLNLFLSICWFLQAVELSDCEKTQALALQLLLSLVKNNQHRTHEMECYHGYSMIHQVLIKPKCIVGYHILKVSFSLSDVVNQPKNFHSVIWVTI